MKSVDDVCYICKALTMVLLSPYFSRSTEFKDVVLPIPFTILYFGHRLDVISAGLPVQQLQDEQPHHHYLSSESQTFCDCPGSSSLSIVSQIQSQQPKPGLSNP